MFSWESNTKVNDEASLYKTGQQVELKHKPGVVDVIIAYDEMMVPPIYLANDPQPRYPEELNLVSTTRWTGYWLDTKSFSSKLSKVN